MTYSNWKVTREDGVARVHLDRAQAANSLDIEASRELMLVAIECDEDPDVRGRAAHRRGQDVLLRRRSRLVRRVR